MRKSILAGSLAAAVVFGLAGCGSSGGPGETLPEPTAELTKDGSQEFLETYGGGKDIANIDHLLLSLSGSGSGMTMTKAMLGANKKEDMECISGSGTVEYSGDDPNAEENNDKKSGVLKRKFVREKCDQYGHGIKKSGTYISEWNWKRSGNKTKGTWDNTVTGHNEGEITKETDNARFVLASNSYNGKFHSEWDNTKGTGKNSGNYTEKSSGNLTAGDRKIELKSFIVTKKWNSKYGKDTHSYSGEVSLSGAINDSKYNGWLVIATIKKFVEKYENDSSCTTQGEMTIRGKDHRITIKVKGKEIVTYYDEEELNRQQACD